MGVAAAMQLSSAANQYVDQRAPWAQAKDPAQAAELDTTLAALARCVAALATLLHPFMPGKTAGLAERLGFQAVRALADIATMDMTGQRVSKGEILFPKT